MIALPVLTALGTNEALIALKILATYPSPLSPPQPPQPSTSSLPILSVKFSIGKLHHCLTILSSLILVC